MATCDTNFYVEWETDSDDPYTIWYMNGDMEIGMAPEPIILENQPWTIIEDEADWVGIYQQLRAAELGYKVL